MLIRLACVADVARTATERISSVVPREQVGLQCEPAAAVATLKQSQSIGVGDKEPRCMLVRSYLGNRLYQWHRGIFAPQPRHFRGYLKPHFTRKPPAWQFTMVEVA